MSNFRSLKRRLDRVDKSNGKIRVAWVVAADLPLPVANSFNRYVRHGSAEHNKAIEDPNVIVSVFVAGDQDVQVA